MCKLKRILSVLLLLSMVLGLLPVPAYAEDASEGAVQSDDYLSRIQAIETGTRYSKYVAHPVPISGGRLSDSSTFLKGLNGNFILVGTNPINGVSYAIDFTRSARFSHYVLDDVTIVEDQVFGVDPRAAVNIAYHSGSKDEVLSGGNSARARYYLKTSDGYYLNIIHGTTIESPTDSKLKQLVTRTTTKISTTIYIICSTTGVYIYNSEKYNDTVRTGVVLSTDMTPPYARSSHNGAKEGNASDILLFKEKADRVNTDSLYNALMEAKEYLDQYNPYEADKYPAFLEQVDAAITAYNTYNKDSYSTTASTVATAQTKVNNQVKALEDAMAWVKPYDQQIRELLIPATDKATAAPDGDGMWFVVGKDTNGFNRVANLGNNYQESATVSGVTYHYRCFSHTPIYLDGEQILTDSLNNALEFYDYSTSDVNRYVLQHYSGDYINIKNVSDKLNFCTITLDEPHWTRIEPVGTDTFYLARNFEFTHTDGKNVYPYWFFNGYTVRVSKNPDHKTPFYLYQVSPLTAYLYRALRFVEVYAGGNADGKYEQSSYDAFAAKLGEALDFYVANRHRMSGTSEQQAYAETLTEQLDNCASLLTLASDTPYIDIAVEVMDFRSDKFLFEYYPGEESNYYSLTTATSLKSDFSKIYSNYTTNTSSPPGLDGTSSPRINLTTGTLVNGNIAYAEHTIAYVAAAVLSDWLLDSSDSRHTTYATDIKEFTDGLANTDWNNMMWKKMTTLHSSYKNANSATKKQILGNLEDTLTKTEGGYNGAPMKWNKVSTAFDLAYYALTHIWQPVLEEDAAAPKPYNTTVTERDTLRLYYDSATRLYSINSVYHMANSDDLTQGEVYDDYILYNTVPRKPANLENFPRFTPINGMGFEAKGVETDPGTFRATGMYYERSSKETNFGFSLHASASFVYYADQNQYFEFVGDDDVYFFVNGKLALDIGGAHSPAKGVIDLRTANETMKLGLVDGEVYTFDMFYAERHTFGSNISFSTNIKLVDTNTLTEKGQYLVQAGTQSLVDPNTGKGSVLDDYAMLNVEDIVAYSFELTNRREIPVYELSFSDPSLGVSLSKDLIATYDATLTDGSTVLSLTNSNPGYANGVATRLEDLILDYVTLDSLGQAYTGPITRVSATEMLALIQNTTKLPTGTVSYVYTTLPEGYYRVKVQTVEELRALLEAGLPMYCYFSIYGFLRKCASSDTPYTNELTATCLYRRSNHVDAIYAQITGKASRAITVPDETSMPQVLQADHVLDYGKSLLIPYAQFSEHIRFAQGSSASAGSFYGLVRSGFHGQLLKNTPADALCTSENPDLDGTYGKFTREAEGLRYSLKEFLEGVDQVYAVVGLNNFNLSGSNVGYKYILIQLNMIPGTAVYYEAEDFTNEIAHVQKITDPTSLYVSYNNQWGIVGDGTSGFQESAVSGAIPQIPDYSQDEDVLFFGFGNTEADRARYTNMPQYKGTNFDTSKWIGSTSKFAKSATISNEEGVLTIVPKLGVRPEDYSSTSKEGVVTPGGGSAALYGDNSDGGVDWKNTSEKALDFDPENAEVYQVRFKMKNLDVKLNSSLNDTSPYLGLHLWSQPKEGMVYPDGHVAARCIETCYINPDMLTADEYITCTIALGKEMPMVETVWGVRSYFGNILGDQTLEGYLKIDYIYIGPAHKAPIPYTYGYDSSRETGYSNGYSEGTSLYTEGNGVRLNGTEDPANYTEAQFTFTGTGFDLISRTGNLQGDLRVDIYTDPSLDVRYRIRGSSVNLKGMLELYQVPVYSERKLEYGTYYVTVGINRALTEDDFPKLPGLDFSSLYRGNQFYLDAIRIYDPIDVSLGANAPEGSQASIAYSAYCADREAFEDISEVRDLIISGNDLDLTSNNDRAVFVDYNSKPSGTENENVTYKIETYIAEGPNNEVYLAPEQLIAFKLLVYYDEIPDRMDFGAKGITATGNLANDQATLSIKAWYKNSSKTIIHCSAVYETVIKSTNAQYYSLELNDWMFTRDKDDKGIPCYSTIIVVSNISPKATTGVANVLSLTDIKVAYDHDPGEPTAPAKRTTASSDIELPDDEFDYIRYVIDGDVSETIEESLEQQYGPCEDHSSSQWVTVTPLSSEEDGLFRLHCDICGELLDEKTVPHLSFLGASVSLSSDLAINYKVWGSFFTEQGYSDPYVVIYARDREYILRDYREQDGLYVFTFANIAPHEVGDVFSATLYASYDGELYHSEVKEYSVATYCYNMLGNASGEQYATLRTLLVDILHYGAKTQEYMNYRLDELCNRALTEEQLAYGTNSYRELISHQDRTYVKIEDPSVSWKGAGLNLRESVAMRFKIQAESYEGLRAEIQFAGQSYTVSAEDFDYRSEGTYIHFRELNAAQMSEPVYVTVYRGEEQVSHTIRYSVESYAYAKQSDSSTPYLAELVKAMMAYGDSAKAYVESTQ